MRENKDLQAQRVTRVIVAPMVKREQKALLVLVVLMELMELPANQVLTGSMELPANQARQVDLDPQGL